MNSSRLALPSNLVADLAKDPLLGGSRKPTSPFSPLLPGRPVATYQN